VYRVARALESGVSVISEGFKIFGNAETAGAVEFCGEIDGELRCSSLIVSRSARITGAIDAERVIVDGIVEGPICASEVMLKSHASVLGDIECQSLHVEEGACLQGNIVPAVSCPADALQVTQHHSATSAFTVAAWGIGPEDFTRMVELTVEARHRLGDPGLFYDDALEILAEAGDCEAMAILSSQKTCLRGGKVILPPSETTCVE